MRALNLRLIYCRLRGDERVCMCARAGERTTNIHDNKHVYLRIKHETRLTRERARDEEKNRGKCDKQNKSIDERKIQWNRYWYGPRVCVCSGQKQQQRIVLSQWICSDGTTRVFNGIDCFSFDSPHRQKSPLILAKLSFFFKCVKCANFEWEEN